MQYTDCLTITYIENTNGRNFSIYRSLLVQIIGPLCLVYYEDDETGIIIIIIMIFCSSVTQKGYTIKRGHKPSPYIFREFVHSKMISK